MERPLGKRQIALLRTLANPGLFMIVGNDICVSLAKRGLLKPVRKPAKQDDGTMDKGAFYQITPDGLRVVADCWETGVMKFPPPKRKPAKRPTTPD